MTHEEILKTADDLKEDIKFYLGKTWADEVAEKNIKESIMNGIRFLIKVGGESLDFTKNTDGARDLLFKYCLYEDSGQLHDFKENYREDLVNLALMKGRT
ncbi:hypothetical protein B7939_00515 [Eggerthia catenaformis]|nr:hypothetical protein B7939_00515 [Eggerthia catenaformis]